MEWSDRVEIQAPPERVWPWLTEFDRKKQWLKGLLREEWIEGEKGAAGSRFRIEVKEGPGVTPYEGTVLRAERPRVLRSTVTGGCGRTPLTMEVEYRLDDLGGRTRVTYGCVSKTEFGGLLKLLLPLIGWFARRQTRSFHRSLKALVEAES